MQRKEGPATACMKSHTLFYFVAQIWQMKQEEVHAVAHKLLAADRVIHEQQLGWQWRGPDEDALLAGPHSPQATRTLAGSRKKTSSQKAGSEIGENEEMPDGQSQPIPFQPGYTGYSTQHLEYAFVTDFGGTAPIQIATANWQTQEAFLVHSVLHLWLI